MNISFPIIHYTRAETLIKCIIIEKKLEDSAYTFFHEVFKNIISSFKELIVHILFLAVILTVNGKLILLPILIIVGFVVLFIYQTITYFTKDMTTFSSYKHFNEKILFSADSINIIAPYKALNDSFLYKDIAKLMVRFEPVNHKNIQGNIATFTWKNTEETFQYTLPVQSLYEKQQLVNVLSYLYEKKMMIEETGKNGEKLYLLMSESNVGDKFSQQYIDLIGEIGKKEE